MIVKDRCRYEFQALVMSFFVSLFKIYLTWMATKTEDISCIESSPRVANLNFESVDQPEKNSSKIRR